MRLWHWLSEATKGHHLLSRLHIDVNKLYTEIHTSLHQHCQWSRNLSREALGT